MKLPGTRRALPTFGIAVLVASGPPALAADGKSIYEKVCATCHANGVANAPKYGDKAAWAPRVSIGKDALLASALEGKGVMPPKGGAADLKDDDVKAAVDHMLAAVK